VKTATRARSKGKERAVLHGCTRLQEVPIVARVLHVSFETKKERQRQRTIDTSTDTVKHPQQPGQRQHLQQHQHEGQPGRPTARVTCRRTGRALSQPQPPTPRRSNAHLDRA